jgi:hypothetical protein
MHKPEMSPSAYCRGGGELCGVGEGTDPDNVLQDDAAYQMVISRLAVIAVGFRAKEDGAGSCFSA